MAANEQMSFRRGSSRRPAGSRGPGALVALLVVVVALMALTRPWWTPAPPTGTLIEVRGDVPAPGLYAVEPATAEAALRAAGADPSSLGALPATPLAEGDRLEVQGTDVVVAVSSNPLLVALPIDVNQAGPEAVAAIPGISRRVAEALVADRASRGPYRSVDDLARVAGIGHGLVEQMQPFIVVGEVAPLDLNRATVAELEALPGIGPVLAARIVVDRADRGPFTSPDDLARVAGVGASTVAAMRELVVVEP